MLSQCPRCHYPFDGLPEDHACPECGLRYDRKSGNWPAQNLSASARHSYVAFFGAVVLNVVERLLPAAWTALTPVRWAFGGATIAVLLYFAREVWHYWRRRETGPTLSVGPDGLFVCLLGCGPMLIPWHDVSAIDRERDVVTIRFHKRGDLMLKLEDKAESTIQEVWNDETRAAGFHAAMEHHLTSQRELEVPPP